MRKSDPHGLLKIGDDVLRGFEEAIFGVLVAQGVLHDGDLAPWYRLEDVTLHPSHPQYKLKPDEVWEGRALPPVALGRTAAAPRDLILE